MNVFGRASDRWRKSRKRGVSPIIATILLVAITVVLAAVLYVLVSGLTKTGASTPYQLGMAESTATSSGSNYYVTLTLAPTSGLTTSITGLSVSNVGGVTQATVAAAAGCKANVAYATTTCTATAGGWYAVLVYSNNTIEATWGSATAAWTYASGTTTLALTGAYSLVVVSPTLYDGAGYTISAYGTGTSSVSGSATL